MKQTSIVELLNNDNNFVFVSFKVLQMHTTLMAFQASRFIAVCGQQHELERCASENDDDDDDDNNPFIWRE